MGALTFEVKSHELDKDTLYRLDDEGFSWSNTRGEDRMAYADIASIHLMVSDSTYGRGRLCRVRDTARRKRVFRSLHCFHLGSFEDRIAGYGPFVRELLKRVGEESPKVSVTRGSMFEYVVLWIGLSLLVFSGAITLLAVFGAGIAPDPGIMGFALFIVLMIPIVIGFMKRRKPRRIDPFDPPRELVEQEPDGPA